MTVVRSGPVRNTKAIASRTGGVRAVWSARCQLTSRSSSHPNSGARRPGWRGARGEGLKRSLRGLSHSRFGSLLSSHSAMHTTGHRSSHLAGEHQQHRLGVWRFEPWWSQRSRTGCLHTSMTIFCEPIGSSGSAAPRHPRDLIVMHGGGGGHGGHGGHGGGWGGWGDGWGDDGGGGSGGGGIGLRRFSLS